MNPFVGKRMRIEICDDAVNEGTPRSVDMCPVALKLCEYDAFSNAEVTQPDYKDEYHEIIEEHGIHLYDMRGHRINITDVDHRIYDWIRAFDTGSPVGSFAFDIVWHRNSEGYHLNLVEDGRWE